jgi:chaperonin GroES
VPLSPIKDQILILPITIPGGSDVQIPSDTKTPVIVGRVISVGPGKYENGAYVPIEVSVDDYIVVGKYAGMEILISTVLHVMVSSGDIRCKYVP